MRAIPASFLPEILCLLAFQSHIGLGRRSQPPPTNRIMQTSLSVSGFCRASGLVQMSFLKYDSPRRCGALGVPRVRGLQMESELLASRSQHIDGGFQQLAGGGIEDERQVAALSVSTVIPNLFRPQRNFP